LSAVLLRALATQAAESRSAVAAAAVLADSLAARALLAWIEDSFPAARLAAVQTVNSSANSRRSATSSTLAQALLAED
jgi:hypothetical protein